jgi:ZIP family zinc transporter
MDRITLGCLASLAAGLATGVGALPALAIRRGSDRTLDAMLGFAAGIMITAASFELLVPSLRLGGISITGLGFLAGVAFLDLVNLIIPHFDSIRGAEGASSRLRRVWLVILAMVIHNIPEGLAVGVSFGQESPSAGVVLAVAIGLHNVPEGLAMALAVLREGYGRWRAVGSALLSGLMEPLVGIPSLILVSTAQAQLYQNTAWKTFGRNKTSPKKKSSRFSFS